ncbi:nucleolus and neural progenitor protein-like [Actinia tenebrosa]|uniref:Nucleolus and neural progenitor protein-like n=1 Tax=Actinia tenebrosa TaxID=6105 RepID=A0A6P8INW5_ACTTE|nr:nucleolus and neural progenitor protein-like [Actinia tenebrosa]
MADEVASIASWNIRAKNNEFTIKTAVFKSENINPEITDEVKKKLSSMSRYAAKNLLWSEMNTMKSVIYKQHNQHRKEKYFQGMKRIQKHLARLREMNLEALLSSFIDNMPKKDSATNSYPCVQAIEYALFNLMGAAKLITQAIGHCKSTINYVGHQLSKGFFITFHIVIAASLSRIWVLLKDFVHNILECYQKLHPLLIHLQETSQEDLKPELPTCLKTWILNIELDKTLTETQKSEPELVTAQTSVVLEKLFSFTPASVEKLVAASLSDVSYTDVAQPCDDIGESFDSSLNSTGSLLDASQPVSRELFKDVSYNTSMTISERCGTKHKLEPDIELQHLKRLHLDQDANYIPKGTRTLEEMNSNNLMKERSYRMIHCPNLKLKHSTRCGTFKIPCMGTKRVLRNVRLFESKEKGRRKLQDKVIKQQLKKGKKSHSRTLFKTKRIIINANCRKSKRILKMEKKYQSRWKRKISSIVGQRKLKKTQKLSPQSNLTIDVKQSFNMAPSLNSSFPNVQNMHHRKDSKEQCSLLENLSLASGKYFSGFSSLDKLSANEDSLLSRRKESGKPSKRIVRESKRISFEKRKPNSSLKDMSNGNILCHAKDDCVDDIFDILGV